MIKKQQKWIALLVAVTFIWLLHVSAMPLAAENSTDQAGMSGAGQGPDYFEAVGHKAAAASKKSILPIILVGVGAVAVAAVLVLVVFKTKYDVVGTWTFNFVGPTTESYVVVFSGTKASGTFAFAIYSGTYTADGKDVVMAVNGFPQVQFSGAFTGKDAMSGIWKVGLDQWNWTALRNGSSSTANPTPAAGSRLLTR